MMLHVSIVLLLVLIFTTSVDSEVIPYNNHVLHPLRPEFLTIPKLSTNDAPHWSPGKGRSYIDISRLKFYTSCGGDIDSSGCKNTTLELLMFVEPSDKFWMDYWTDRNFCCTEEMVIAGTCSVEGKLIIPSALSEAFVRPISIAPDVSLTLPADNILSHHDIKDTGLYILFMAICNPSSNPVRIDGSIDSLDPYGYLPADLYQNLPFYGSLSCLHTIVGVAWFILCLVYRGQLITLQMWITIVLGLGMIETTVLFAHYLHWNDFGIPSLSLSTLGLVCGVSKRAASRILVTLVALGYGFVRPSLGEDMNRVLYLGSAYFVLSLLYTFMTHLPASFKAVDGPDVDLLSLCVFLLAGIDTAFYIWIFTSINSLLTSLAARKQAVKYLLYRNFRAVLFVSLFFTCVWALYSSVMLLNNGNGEESNWLDRWTVDALWELTYFFVFVSIAVMWAPSKNSQRYSSSIELTQLEEDTEWLNNASLEEDDDENDGDNIDAEYGGKLNEDGDPFSGTGALDTTASRGKKS